MSTISPLTTALFTGADKNADKKLSAAEFAKIAPAVTGDAKPSASATAAAFKKLDTDGDDSLTAAELAQATFSSGSSLSPEAQANINAYASIASGSFTANTTSNVAAGLYAALNPASSGGAALTERLLGSVLSAKGLLA